MTKRYPIYVEFMDKAIQRAIYIYDGLQFQRIAYTNETAPGTGGRPYGRYIELRGFNDAGQVAFTAPLVQLNTEVAQSTLYLATAGSTPVRIAGPGDDAPETNGGKFGVVGGVSLNSAGEVLFSAPVVGGQGGNGLFVWSPSGMRKVVSHGDALPPPLSGTFDFAGGVPASRFNNSGKVAFICQGSLFVETPGAGIAPVIIQGDPVPAPLGGTFGSTTLYAFNGAGQIAFIANLNGSAGTSLCLFRYTPGSPLDIVAWRNMNAPRPAEARFGSFTSPSMNAGGLITFQANLSGTSVPPDAPTPRGIFQQGPGTFLTDIVIEGDNTPLAGGGKYGQPATAGVTLNDGTTPFHADVLDGAAYAGTFLYSGGSTVSLTSTENPLPAGSHMTLRTWSVGTGGGIMVFRAAPAGGQEGIFVHNLLTGKTSGIVADGDPIPGVTGRLDSSAGGHMKIVNEAGEVAFSGRPWGGGGPVMAVPNFLRTAAGALGRWWRRGMWDFHHAKFTSIGLNSSPPTPGQRRTGGFFRATLTGTPSPNPAGVFIGAAGSDPAKVVMTGEPAPVDPPGNFTNFSGATINNAGQVAFRDITTGDRQGIYLVNPGGAPAKVVAGSDPGPSGSTFPQLMPTQFSFNDLGEVAFITPLDGGPGGGVFVGTGAGSPVPVALKGDLAPLGGYFSFPSARPDLHLNDSGDLVFRADLTGGNVYSGLFLIRRKEAILHTILVQGQAAPGIGGNFETLLTALNGVAGEEAALTPAGEVWTSQLVLVGGEHIVSYFLFRHNNRLEKVFARGDPVPAAAAERSPPRFKWSL